ncbi:MAG: hypothetical protein WCR71_04425 [Bacteroidales bacterium]
MKSKLEALGFFDNSKENSKDDIHQYIKLRLEALGLIDDACGQDKLSSKDVPSGQDQLGEKDAAGVQDVTGGFFALAKSLIINYRERERQFRNYLCPADQRIQNFINNYFKGLDIPEIRVPSFTFTLDFYGIARELSLPEGCHEYLTKDLMSYRVKQGVLHNSTTDRRTTKGTFHLAEGGLPIPDDKKAVPALTAALLLHKATQIEGDIFNLPFTEGYCQKVKVFASLLLRPLIIPEVEGISTKKTMEVRFFAPGSLVCNLDFIESIYGNGGSPYHIQNDAGLDCETWSGHTGCVILAPQLCKVTKKEVGLPHISKATDRQKRDRMCWEKESELYSDGVPFKLSMRTEEGVIVTLLADTYFGYTKKEIKTFISYAANLFGNAEEEHAGGALIFPSYNQGEGQITKAQDFNTTLDKVSKLFTDVMDMKPGGYGVDRNYKDIIYVPELSRFDIKNQSVTWIYNNQDFNVKLLPNNTYILPNGHKYRMEKAAGTLNYRLVETNADGVMIHKPCTVSGGGKSEISKSISDSVISGSFFVKDFDSDFKKVERIIDFNYYGRYKTTRKGKTKSRSFLSNKRSMGSSIKLLTPSPEFTDKYNAWLNSIPQYIKGIAFIVKRFYREEWGNSWKDYFSVDILNGLPGNELKYQNKKISARYFRVGYDSKGAWRTFKLRQDYVYAEKLQMEDDITASTVVPTSSLSNLSPIVENKSVKILANCEYRFFQRPDEAINRGLDCKAEQELSMSNMFISNFEPLTVDDAAEMVEDVINFDLFTDPMRNLILDVAQNRSDKYFVSSSNPRVIDGKPSKNMRYLQGRDDIVNPRNKYIAEIGMRIARLIPTDKPLYIPVNSVLPGRRNNPAQEGIRPLAVYNPVHYQELPELFMDFICSLTGKSPSTTGSGSEGALTKTAFNAMPLIIDLNNALVSFVITGYHGFTTPTGYIGKKHRIDHDLSLLIPELWARLQNPERDPAIMIKNGYLEKVEDFEHNGNNIPASVLGYRITEKFVNGFFGRVFENPNVIFPEDMLRPELQSVDEFADGVLNIVESHKKIAEAYFRDGSIDNAVPPLKALLSIMVHGNYEGKGLNSPEIRELFTYKYVVESNWYKARLVAKQQSDISLYSSHIKYLEKIMREDHNLSFEMLQSFNERLDKLKEKYEYVCSNEYAKNLFGTIGRDQIKS